jgi:hypothetical protein
VSRASLMPIWQWLVRDGAPEAFKEFEAVLAHLKESATAADFDKQVRKFQLAASEAIAKIATPVPGDKQRALSRVGPPNVIEDMLPIGAVLSAHEALDTLNGRLPSYLRIFGESQIISVTASLNVATLQTSLVLPFALSLVMQRLSAPWQIIRLAIKVEHSTEALVQSLRGVDSRARAFRQQQVKAAIRFCDVLFGHDYASLMGRAAENALSGERKSTRAG